MLDSSGKSNLEKIEKVKTLRDWFTTNGGKIHDAVEIVASESNGCFLWTRHGQTLRPGTPVVSCPHDITISVMDVEWANDPWPKTFISRWRFNPEVLTRLFLMEEYLTGTGSFWWPYIQLLPQPDQPNLLGTPLWYEESDCIWIRGTNLDGSRISREAAWREELDESLGLLTSSEGFLRPLVSQYTWKLYKWAATILTSRCFLGSALANRVIHDDSPNASTRRRVVQKWTQDVSISFPVLLPVFDITNHSPLAKVSWGLNAFDCTFVTEHEVAGGAQIWNNYGYKGNEELIMGYGFSLFGNKADTSTLALSSSHSMNIRKVKERQQEVTKQLEELATHYVETSSNNKASPKRVMSPGVVVQPDSSYTHPPSLTVKGTSEVFYISPITDNPFSSLDQNLLDTLSIMVANNRELKNSQITPTRSWIPQQSHEVTHNKAMVACQLFKALRHQYSKITRYNGQLPLWPANEKQFHAARYRRSQLHILNSVMMALTRELMTATPKAGNRSKNYLVDLKATLTSTYSPSLRQQFRAAIQHSLYTTSPRKIRKGGYQDLVFTIWICSVYLDYTFMTPPPATTTPTTSFTFLQHEHLFHWTNFLTTNYGPPKGWSSSSSSSNVLSPIPSPEDVIASEASVPSQSECQGDSDSVSDTETQMETHAIATSYLPIILAAAENQPDSIYADQKWSVDFLAWGYTILREEGILVPDSVLDLTSTSTSASVDLGQGQGQGQEDEATVAAGGIERGRGEEGDVFMLFLET